MKRIVLLFAFCLAIVAGTQAQATMKSATGYVADTVVNTATKFVSVAASNSASSVAIQLQADKISGTGAGTASLLGSVDGVNFRSISSTTFTLTDVASQGFIWTITGNPYTAYRISVVGSGTESMRIAGKLLKR